MKLFVRRWSGVPRLGPTSDQISHNARFMIFNMLLPYTQAHETQLDAFVCMVQHKPKVCDVKAKAGDQVQVHYTVLRALPLL